MTIIDLVRNSAESYRMFDLLEVAVKATPQSASLLKHFPKANGELTPEHDLEPDPQLDEKNEKF
jgi:hypothetical protein